MLLASTGLLVTFTAGLWNIGVEGQIVMGAIAASWIALKLSAPGPVLVVVELLAALAHRVGRRLERDLLLRRVRSQAELHVGVERPSQAGQRLPEGRE